MGRGYNELPSGGRPDEIGCRYPPPTTGTLNTTCLWLKASSWPCSRWRRQVVMCDEYSPSRRSRAPISPGSLQASASVRMRSLYSVLKRLRLARGYDFGIRCVGLVQFVLRHAFLLCSLCYTNFLSRVVSPILAQRGIGSNEERLQFIESWDIKRNR
jgi:hypothetical protein